MLYNWNIYTITPLIAIGEETRFHTCNNLDASFISWVFLITYNYFINVYVVKLLLKFLIIYDQQITEVKDKQWNLKHLINNLYWRCPDKEAN